MVRTGRKVELQGHRGARGFWPENTIPGFKAALAAGADALELDVEMSRDGAIVVTHDDTLNPDVVQLGGTWILEPVPVKSLTAAELRAYHVGRLRPGSDYAQRFPHQRPVENLAIPLLRNVMALPELRARPGICLDIEIKTSPLDEHATFAPQIIAEALAREVSEAGLQHACRVRSFDWRALEAFRELQTGIPIACLTAEQPWLDNIARSGADASPWLAGINIQEQGGSVARAVHAFGAEVWAPYYCDLDTDELARAHELGLSVIVWTVNEEADMRKLLRMGVDGITTDYPEIGRREIDAMINNE